MGRLHRIVRRKNVHVGAGSFLSALDEGATQQDL
jgi:hypothetical protein